MTAATHPTRRTLRRLVTGTFLVVLIGSALALAAPSANAEPTPHPGLAPAAPAKPTPQPLPTPNPNPNPNPTPTPNPTPAPSPGPSPSPPSDSGNSDDNPAWYDIPGQIRKAINDFFAKLVRDNIASVMSTLGTTVLATPDLTGNDKVRTFWTTSLVTTNAVFVLFIVAAGFLVASRETLQTRHGLKQVLPRLAFGAVAANTSLLLCEKLLWATNALTAAIAGQGVDGNAAGAAISQVLGNAEVGNSLLLTLLELAVLVAVIVVVIMFLLRVAALVLLVGVAPLALVCHALPQTEGLAYTWWRAVGACLGIQLAQAVVILAAVRIFFTPVGSTVLGTTSGNSGIMGVLVCLCMLWILIKIPGWAKQFILGPLGQRSGRGLISQLVHTYLTIKTLGMATGVLKGAKAAHRAGTATRAAKPGTGTRPGARGRIGPARPAAPGPVRRAPAPAGPAAFSHAPTVHAALGQPMGTAGVPRFSHAPSPASSPSPTGAVPPAMFSSAPQPQPASPTPASSMPAGTAGSADPVVFSHASGHTPRLASGPPPAVTFSAAPGPQTAAKRPPAPVAPVFSAAPTTGEVRRTTARPTAARQAPGTTTGSGTGTARTATSGPDIRASRPAASAPARPVPEPRLAVPAPPRPAPVPYPRPSRSATPRPAVPPVPAPVRHRPESR